MRVIITGANGFIGSNLVEKFYQNGDEVVAIIKDKNENIEKIKDYAKIYYCGLNDLDSIYDELALTNEKTVFYHLAWIGVNGQEKTEYVLQIENIKMACACAVFAKKLNCTRILFAGTVAENAVDSYKNNHVLSLGLLYSTSKVSAHLFVENICKNIGMPFVWMQFSNIYGPSNKTGNLVSYTIAQLVKGEDATFGPAQQPYDFIFINDLIDAVYRLGVKDSLKHDCYFIGSGSPRILKDYLEEIGKIYGSIEHIKIGIRNDDGIKYSFDMFSIDKLVEDIGVYVTKTYTEGIKYTIENY